MNKKLLISFSALLILAGCAQPVDTNKSNSTENKTSTETSTDTKKDTNPGTLEITDFHTNNGTYYTVLKDKVTGCEYLVFDGKAITPRMTSNGNIKCGPSEKTEAEPVKVDKNY